jgi:hypothetical protein
MSIAICPVLSGRSARPPAKPTIVTVGMYVNRIHNIDVRTQSFEADFYLWLRWKGQHAATDYEFVNNKEMEKRKEIVETDSVGAQYLSVRILGTFLSTFDVSNYPQDTHVLLFRMEDYNWNEQQLRYVVDTASTRMLPADNSGEWNLRFLGAIVEPEIFLADSQKYSSFKFLVQAERSMAPFVVKILIPIIIVVLMSMLTFFIPPKELETQVALGATALLTVIALKFVIADTLPDVPYLTRADILLIGSYVVVFLALCESVFTHYLFRKGKEPVSRKIDRACRVVFPFSYALFLFILL